jgi:hypothetical protein
MKVTIEFDGLEEKDELQSAIDGGKWKALVVWEIDQELRKVVKYNSSIIDASKPASLEEVEFADKFREFIREMANGYGLVIE